MDGVIDKSLYKVMHQLGTLVDGLDICNLQIVWLLLEVQYLVERIYLEDYTFKEEQALGTQLAQNFVYMLLMEL